MSAYLIVDVDVKDNAAYEEYRRVAPPIVAKYGGRFVVRGGPHEVLEGDWKPARLVLIEFESVERAHQFYDSEEYQGPKALRLGATRSAMVLVQGV